MVRDVDNVLIAALQLPAEARAALAAELIESLDQGDQGELADDVEEAWSEEIQRRLAEVDAGTVTPVPWLSARSRILAAASGRGKTG